MGLAYISAGGVVVQVSGDGDEEKAANLAIQVYEIIFELIQRLTEQQQEEEEVKRNEVV